MASTTEDDEWAITDDDVHSQPFNPETVLRAEFPDESDDEEEDEPTDDPEARQKVEAEIPKQLEKVPIDNWDQVKDHLKSTDDQEHEAALRLLRKYVESHGDEGATTARKQGILILINDSLYSYNPKIQIAASRILTSIAKSEYIIEELRHNGSYARLEYLRNAQNNRVAKVADVAIDHINNCVKSIGFGPLPLDDSGIQRYERNVITRQERFKRCGVGHRLWPAATVLSRWIYEYREIFHDKKIIELGCGPALAGLLVAPYCKSVLLTDYLDVILKMADANAKLNGLDNAKSGNINWEEVSNGTVTELPESDIIIASDVIYGVALAHLLSATVAKLLAVKKGTFYGCMQSNRIGIEEFIEDLEQMGLKVEHHNPDDKYIVGINTRNIWTFIKAHY